MYPAIIAICYSHTPNGWRLGGIIPISIDEIKDIEGGQISFALSFFDFHYQLTELICEYMYTSEIDSLKAMVCCKDWLYKYPTNESTFDLKPD